MQTSIPMEKKDLNTFIVLALVIGFVAGGLGGGIASFLMFTTLRLQPGAISQAFSPRPTPYAPPVQAGWHATDPTAANSVQGKLLAQGKTWVKTPGDPAPGAYVMDIYEGRMNQPQGRGAIGKVLSVCPNTEGGGMGAWVDFGRGYVAGIKFSELSAVKVSP